MTCGRTYLSAGIKSSQEVKALPSLLKTRTSKTECRNRPMKAGRMCFAGSLSAILAYQRLSKYNLARGSSVSAILTATSLPCHEPENTVPVLPRPRKPFTRSRGIVEDKISSVFQYLYGSPWSSCSVSVVTGELTRGAASPGGTSPNENASKACKWSEL